MTASSASPPKRRTQQAVSVPKNAAASSAAKTTIPIGDATRPMSHVERDLTTSVVNPYTEERRERGHPCSISRGNVVAQQGQPTSTLEPGRPHTRQSVNDARQKNACGA